MVGWYYPLPPVRKSADDQLPLKVHNKPTPPPPARLVRHKPIGEVVPTLSLKPPKHSEHELLAQLWKESSEVDLREEADAAKRTFGESVTHMELRRSSAKDAPPLTKTIRALLDARSDLQGLPLQDEKACQSSPEAVKILALVSPRVRRLQPNPADLADMERMAAENEYARYIPKTNEALLKYVRATVTEHKSNPTIVRPMEQMIQTEKVELRLGLVESLALVKGKEATEAIARRAVFDLSPVVRDSALKALAKRSLDDARPVFLAALRHPWATAADHAALALTELNDQKAYQSVRKLVDAPDPCEPFQEEKKWYVRELVRVNHLRNCLLCHAASSLDSDPVRAPIPEPGKPLPSRYYASRLRSPSIRADIVYFRQDFSAIHKVDKPDEWPKFQRFDYLVRKRELTAKEVEKRTAQVAQAAFAGRSSYPQRDAMLYTLYQLAFARERADKPSR